MKWSIIFKFISTKLLKHDLKLPLMDKKIVLRQQSIVVRSSFRWIMIFVKVAKVQWWSSNHAHTPGRHVWETIRMPDFFKHPIGGRSVSTSPQELPPWCKFNIAGHYSVTLTGISERLVKLLIVFNVLTVCCSGYQFWDVVIRRVLQKIFNWHPEFKLLFCDSNLKRTCSSFKVKTFVIYIITNGEWSF